MSHIVFHIETTTWLLVQSLYGGQLKNQIINMATVQNAFAAERTHPELK